MKTVCTWPTSRCGSGSRWRCSSGACRERAGGRARPAYENLTLELAHTEKKRLTEAEEAKLKAEHRRLAAILYGTEAAPGHVRARGDGVSDAISAVR